jgi:hypothetical protein
MRLARWGRLGALCTLAAVVFLSAPARAALTDSEKAQIRGFVQQNQLVTAQRVRALVARPDLSSEESTAALADALVPITFRDAGVSYLRELIFGGPSLSGRPVLVSAVLRALVARADAVLSKRASDLDQQPEALAELARIYTFFSAQIANAGQPGPLPGHDAQAGIPASTYDDCVHVLADHIQRNPRWLSPESPVSPAFARVRAAAELALYEMMNDSPTRRVDAAVALGLSGARRRLLTELGVLIVDSGAADDARIGRVRLLLLRLASTLGPHSTEIEAIDFGDVHPVVRPRGTVASVPVPLETAPSQTGLESEEIDTVPLDLPLFVLAYELSKPVAARVLASRPDLRAWADRDVQAKEAPTGSMTTEDRVANMMAQLLVDAPRTVDLAFSRFLAGRSRTAGLLSDALGVLASTGGTATLGLGHSAGNDGETERFNATGVNILPAGAATSFILGGHRWEIQRDASGLTGDVRCDGKPVTLAVLHTARVPVTEALSWTSGGLVFARLSGAPRAGVAAGSRLRVIGIGEADAIATPAPGDDVIIEADLSVSGGEGGIIARAISNKTSFQGASLMLIPSSGGPAHAVLRVNDGAVADANLGQPVEIPSPSAHVKIVVKGAAIEATVGSVTLKGVLPAALAHGDVGVRAHKGATVEAAGLTLRKK